MTIRITHAERSALQWLAAQGGLASAHAFNKHLNTMPSPQFDRAIIESLATFGLIAKQDGFSGSHWYQIAAAGREALFAQSQQDAAEPAPSVDPDPAPAEKKHIDIEDVPRPTDAEIAAVMKLVLDAVTVRIEEIDLDSWWGELDVEIKAEVFLLYTLGSGGVRVDAEHDEPATVPVIGVAGESAEKWSEMAARLNGLPPTELCYYCHAPFAGPLQQASLSRHATMLRRVCNRNACLDRWTFDLKVARNTIARGGELGGDPLAPTNIQDAERAAD